MAIRYPEKIKEQAKKMFGEGLTYQTIADELKIPRKMTICTWKQKGNWKRFSELDPEDNELEIYEALAIKAKEFLKDQSFSNISEALKVYERSIAKIRSKKAEGEKESPEQQLNKAFNLDIEDEEEYDDD